MEELFSASVGQLAQRIRRREVSPVEVVEAHIARIEEVDGALNALAAGRFEEARREARDAEDVIAAARDVEDLPALLGVPCTIKEFIEVAGMPNTAGLLSRRDVVARGDATVVDRLRDAGAIVLGVSNVPEGGMWIESANKIYGRTNNPWNLRRTAGGSSGGEAALIAAGASPFGLGSDIAGSIRIPGAFCGVPGHKPSGRTVPNTGHWGASGHGIGPYLVIGPMARRVEDLPLLLSIIAGPDGRDPSVVERRIGWPADVDLSGVVVYQVERFARLRVWEPMRAAVRRAAEGLAARGAEVRELESQHLDDALRIWALAMNESSSGEAGPTFYDVLGEGERFSVSLELARGLVGRSRFTLPALGLVALERLASLLPQSVVGSVSQLHALREELDRALGDRGVLLLPPFTRPAPIHSTALLTPFDFLCTGIINVLEYPATQVPTGFDGRGLPVGVQVAAGEGRDHLAIAVAAAIEEDSGGWVRADPKPVRRRAAGAR